jgi:hypothetical protein
MGSIEVMRALNDAKVKTRHPLEVVIWTNEEGNHFALGGTKLSNRWNNSRASIEASFKNCVACSALFEMNRAQISVLSAGAERRPSGQRRPQPIAGNARAEGRDT